LDDADPIVETRHESVYDPRFETVSACFSRNRKHRENLGLCLVRAEPFSRPRFPQVLLRNALVVRASLPKGPEPVSRRIAGDAAKPSLVTPKVVASGMITESGF
jgi:hypothetical protein